MYHICVAKELPNCLLYPPSLTIPEVCINVEDVAAVLLTRDAAFIAHAPTAMKLLQQRARNPAAYQP